MALYEKREKFEGIALAIGRIASKLPFTPNQITLLSLIVAIISAYFLINRDFLVAALSFLIASLLDFVDGAVARATNKATKIGAYLDTIADRYVEGLMLVAMLFLPFPKIFFEAKIWIFAVLFGSLLTTYAKAAAKEKGLVAEGELKGGLLERSERVALLFVGIAAAAISINYLLYVLIFLAIVTNISALQRILLSLIHI